MATSLSFDFTQDQLRIFLNNLPNYENWYKSLVVFLPECNITTREQVCAFLAQTHHESAGYRHLSENLNYRWESLRRVWSRRFPTDEIAKQYAHNPERIANKAYADRMGNGNEASGDGWRYRGQGLIQLTGKDNQLRFATDVDRPLSDMVDYLGTYNGAVESACWFWETNDLNRWVDSGDFDGLSDSINLGRKTSAEGDAHGYQDRMNQYRRAMGII
jgi:putative chitinase